MSQVEYKPISCKNCGHAQHCGSPRYMEVRDYGVDCEPYYIKACEMCQCITCSEKLEMSTKDIPISMLNGL
jgi:hypothetical protein